MHTSKQVVLSCIVGENFTVNLTTNMRTQWLSIAQLFGLFVMLQVASIKYVMVASTTISTQLAFVHTKSSLEVTVVVMVISPGSFGSWFQALFP